ncbi:TetR/AcrR family transcriptional regulator [Streptomyces griseoviridis]|uniref:TetR/AcrR family transcriptional regulator n=1 Tax=Streptomyces griseoviridis TaxID=45398 RepID=A0A3S9ZMF0_STRGD|nr:TetR/AcrR family transcriptional regulator [Streptomyces griseoviridis]AZS88812.1 TetR/AcrR family transcriptional regulator [Streptomyces griseoviridis]QCN84348.1 TetR/AcrR family transcriptional regulator [Streptomyces griseoviridis]
MSTRESKKAAGGRRAEYAAATRQAIHEAARELFTGKGYFATTVDDIATAARVAPATVYAVGGGKQGLLKAIIETRTTAPDVEETYGHIAGTADADELLRFITHATRVHFEGSRGLMRVVIDTAPHDAAAAQALRTAHASLRDGLARTARRLAELGALRNGIDVREATDTLWFYLGNGAYFTLTDDNDWPLDKVEQWLHTSLRTALLRSGSADRSASDQ